MTVAEHAFDLDLVPVAGVGQDNAGRLLDADLSQLVSGGADHRRQVRGRQFERQLVAARVAELLVFFRAIARRALR